jgi:hypothetical protein
MVDDTVTRLTYTPFDEAGFDLFKSANKAARFSISASASKPTVPIEQ